MKINNKSIILSSSLCLIPIIISIVFYKYLPDKVATHFNMSGAADGYSSKNFAAFGLPLMMLVINIVVNISMLKDTTNKNTSRVIKNIGIWIVPIISILIQAAIIYYALDETINISKMLNIFMGLLFLIIGNYLPKCRMNHTIGIRTPWTLNDEEVWNKTHKVGGYLWVIGGFLMILLAFLNSMKGVTSLLVICTIVPIVYSFLIYKKSN